MLRVRELNEQNHRRRPILAKQARAIDRFKSDLTTGLPGHELE